MSLVGLQKRRRFRHFIFTLFSLLSMVVMIAIMIAVLSMLLIKGAYVFITMPILLASTPGPTSSGGLLNALYGSIIMTSIAMLIATPVGVLIAYYFIDAGRGQHLTQVIRFLSDVLLSIPSIIVGLFIYVVVVQASGHFSAWAGICALFIIALPIIIRTTEDVLSLLSDPLREAAYALGAPRWQVARLIIFHGARTGVITAMLLAMARIFGETAPLLFTALNNQFFSSDLNQPMASLPVVIFQFAMSPYTNWQDLAWAGALLLTMLVLITSIIARCLMNKRGTST